MKGRRLAWIAYLAGGVVAAVLYLAVPPFAHRGPVFNLIGLSSPVAIAVGVRLHRPARPLPWLLFAVGQTLFVAGDAITYNYQGLFHRPLPFPSIGDVLYLAVYPSLVAGLLLLIHRRSPGRDRASLLDSLILTVGAGLMSWVFLMAPYAHDHNLSVIRKATSIAYPAMDVLLLLVAVRIAVGGGGREPAYRLITLALVSLLVTDAVYGLILLHGDYHPGQLLDLGWILFYLLWGAAALHPSMRRLQDPAPGPEPKHPRRRLALLAAASLVAPAVNIFQSLGGERVDPAVVSACSAILFVLVVVRMRDLMVDITRFRETEARLRQTEATYRNLVEGLPAVVYLAEFGDEGRWLYVSPQVQTMLGFTPEEFTGSPDVWRDRIHPDDRETALAGELALLRDGGRMVCEYRIEARDGRMLWIREEADAVPDEHGQAALLQGVMYDITDQKDAEEALRRGLQRETEAADHLRAVDEMKNSFLHAVSHDLRTPLTSIMGFALTLARPDMQLAPDAQDMAERIADNAKRLNRMLTDLLDVDRLSRGVIEPNRTWCDVADVVRDVLAECSPDGHVLHVDVPSLPARVDRVQVERILDNLVRNAIRYSGSGGSIWIAARRHDDGVLLMVEDDGRGIDANLRESVFEPFRQGQEAGVEGGVGLGLSLVAKFAQLHGGRAWVDERAGGGASVKVFLPNDPRPDAGAANGHAGAPSAPTVVAS